MASTHKSLRSSTANKRPTTAISDGQIALNTNSASPGLFFKDSTGATIIKIGPVHVGTTAPNATPGAGGSSGNSTGEIWLDTSLTPVGVKIWNGSAFVNATPIGSTTVQGLLELATNAETQTGTDVDRAVTPAGLQSKLSDSISTTSSSTIASSTAVKTAYDLAAAAVPLSGGTVTGNLEIGTTGTLSFEGATADAFETTIAVVDPTADRTITLPNVTGTIVTTGDTGTVTSTMLLDGTILNEDINASAAIVDTKLATIATALKVSNSATTATSANTASAIVARDASNNFSAGTITASLSGNASTVTTNANLTGDVTSVGNATSIASGVIVNADVNASAAIAGTKVSPDFGSQTVATTGVVSHALGTDALPTVTFTGDLNTGIYSPGADTLAITTAGSNRLHVTSGGLVGIGITGPAYATHIKPSVVNAYALGLENQSDDSRLLFGSVNSSWRIAATYGSTGSFQPITFFTSDLERARLDSSGRLLVGTSSARSIATQYSAIQNEGTSFGTTGFSTCRNSNDIYGSYIHFGKSRSTSVGGNTIVNAGDDLGGFIFGGGDGTSVNSQAAYILCQVDGTPGANDMPGRLVFSTTADGAASPTERMRIDNAGNTTNFCSGAYGLVSKTSSSAGTTNYILLGSYNASSVTTGTTSFVVYSNGNVQNTNNSYGSLSDIKLKENIVDASSQWDDLKALQVRKYNFKEGQTHTQIGLIAQEAEIVSPGLVSESPDRDEDGNDLGTVTKSVNYSVLYMKAVKALQEAMERIETLEQRLTDAGIA